MGNDGPYQPRAGVPGGLSAPGAAERRRQMRAIRVALLLTAAALSAAVPAATPPPMGPIDDVKNTQSKVPPATGVLLGTFEVTFESSALADMAKLGAAPVSQQGDAASFVMWVCFTLPQERQRLWLTSSELGGHTYIDGVRAEVLARDASPTEDCPELPKQFRPVRLASGVWLGSRIEELERKFGAATPRNQAVHFSYLGKDRGYDVMSTLVVQLRDKRVEKLYAGHSTTN